MMATGEANPIVTVKLTANFEHNLNDIERFLADAGAMQAFDTLLDELTETVIPSLERFPAMGRPFLTLPIRSVEANNGIQALRNKLQKLGERAEVREYVLEHFLLLYAREGAQIYLLSIRHHKQLSFDFKRLWSDG